MKQIFCKRLIIYFVLLLSLTSSLILISACGPKKEQLARSLVWGGPKNISMLPIIADQKGFFSELGLNCKANYVQTGKIAMDALISKDLDFSVIVESNLAFIKYQQGADIQVICSIIEKFDDAIVARKDRGIEKPKDLEGKTVAMLFGTTSHIFADRFFRKYNLDISKINIINLSPPSMQASVINGDIDAASVWQPFRYNIVKEIGDKAIQFNNTDIYKAYAVIAVRTEFANKYKKEIDKFIKALIKAEDFVQNNKDESIQILAKEINMSPEVLSSVWDEYIIRVRLDDGLLQIIREEGDWIHETQDGFKDKPVPSYDNILNPTFLKKIDNSKISRTDF